MDADDVVGIEGSGSIPARREFPVVRGMYLDIYESEGGSSHILLRSSGNAAARLGVRGSGQYETSLLRSKAEGPGH